MSFEKNKTWADTFTDQQFEILNSCIDVLDFNKAKRRGVTFNPAPAYDDMNLETDVIVFGTLRIALRVRRGYSTTFNDIALRSCLPSGCRTEVHKIRDGLGDYYLYCWTSDGENITEWMLIDLDRFREEMDNCLSVYQHFNDDGSAFNTYSIREIIGRGCCVGHMLDSDNMFDPLDFLN